jgi:hypothetical protein
LEPGVCAPAAQYPLWIRTIVPRPINIGYFRRSIRTIIRTMSVPPRLSYFGPLALATLGGAAAPPRSLGRLPPSRNASRLDRHTRTRRHCSLFLMEGEESNSTNQPLHEPDFPNTTGYTSCRVTINNVKTNAIANQVRSRFLESRRRQSTSRFRTFPNQHGRKRFQSVSESTFYCNTGALRICKLFEPDTVGDRKYPGDSRNATWDSCANQMAGNSADHQP